MGKSLGRLIVCLSALTFIFSAPNADAQLSATPSAAQIEQFKKLPPSQQQALAKQFGVDLGQLQRGTTSPSQTVTERPEQQYLDSATSGLVPETKEKEVDKNVVKPFGYDMFEQLQSAFLPGGVMPVPSDYVVGPGDSIEVTLFGKESANHVLTINNQGEIFVPELEPMKVAGLTFQELKMHIAEAVKQKTIGLKSSVSIASLRAIQVYVVGDVKTPGAYQLSSLSTITNALFISGGPSQVGSLRNIELKRAGKTIANLDLYDVFTKGDVTQDQRLQQGDVVFVDSVKSQATVYGEVRRPAIYEMKPNETVDDLLKFAGGLTVNAYPRKLALATFDDNYQRKIVNINKNVSSQVLRTVQNGDVLSVMKISEQLSDVVNIAGAVARPGTYAWSEGFTLNSILRNKDDLLSTTDLAYGLILSQNKDQSYVVTQFRPESIINNEEIFVSKGDLVLFFNHFDRTGLHQLQNESGRIESEMDLGEQVAQEFDQDNANYLWTIYTGDLFQKQEALENTKSLSRRELLQPVINLLTVSSKSSNLIPVVEITGQVKFPGTYPLANNSTLQSVISAAGGYTESANLGKGEISRLIEGANRSADTRHIPFSLATTNAESIQLQARDVINIFQRPNWSQDLTVVLGGEVTYPGTYKVKEGETLVDVLNRAGGLTEFAAPEAAFFTRKSLKELEEQQAKNMARSLSKELAFKSISSTFSNVNITDVQLVVENLTTVEGVGRLVIDLPSQMSGQSAGIKLEHGDELIVPSVRNEVNIIGEVQVATAHVFNKNWSLEDYIHSSGGLRQQADDERVYVIRANGLVDMPSYSWFGSENLDISPGDTIVVPLDAGYTDKLTLWEKATSIFYQLTVGLAALGRL